MSDEVNAHVMNASTDRTSASTHKGTSTRSVNRIAPPISRPRIITSCCPSGAVLNPRPAPWLFPCPFSVSCPVLARLRPARTDFVRCCPRDRFYFPASSFSFRNFIRSITGRNSSGRTRSPIGPTHSVFRSSKYHPSSWAKSIASHSVTGPRLPFPVKIPPRCINVVTVFSQSGHSRLHGALGRYVVRITFW